MAPDDNPPHGTDETKRIVVEVAAEKKAVLDELFGHGELTATYRDMTDRIIEMEGYDRQTVYDARIEQKQQELAHLREQRDGLDNAIDAITDEIHDLRSQRENVLTTEDEYRGALKAVEHDLRRLPDDRDDHAALRCVWPTHPRIETLADEYGRQPEDVHSDLRDRNPDVPDHAFTKGVTGGNFRGFRDEQAQLPVEEREDAPLGGRM